MWGVAGGGWGRVIGLPGGAPLSLGGRTGAPRVAPPAGLRASRRRPCCCPVHHRSCLPRCTPARALLPPSPAALHACDPNLCRWRAAPRRARGAGGALPRGAGGGPRVGVEAGSHQPGHFPAPGVEADGARGHGGRPGRAGLRPCHRGACCFSVWVWGAWASAWWWWWGRRRKKIFIFLDLNARLNALCA